MACHVLGISAFYHDSAACIVRDGEVLFAIEEERLSRVKHDARFPELAVQACLDAAGIRANEVDAVVFYEKTLPKLERQLDTWLAAFPRSYPAFVRTMARYLDGRMDLAGWLRKRYGFRREILFAEHHLSHAAFAWFTSGFQRAMVLVADGVGEWATTSIWTADAAGLRPQREIRFPDSLGLFFSLVTAHLGFRVNDDEYKVMGLAAYGHDAYARAMTELLPLDLDGAFHLDRACIDLAGRDTLATARVTTLLGPARRPGARIEQRHRDVACSAQKHLEAALLHVLSLVPAGEPLCLAGGVALNGLANARIAARHPLHVPFAPGDSGAAIGAALVGSHFGLGHPQQRSPLSPFLGPGFDAAACASAASDLGAQVQPLAAMGGDAFVAEQLAGARILGFFDGRMEFGPRALGHRSILADPRDASMRDALNERVKHREPFRPFAPAIAAERAAEYFDVPHALPWMTEVRTVRPERRADIAAVVHVDGTARVQTVDATESPRLHALLGHFEARTGVPVLLNTSFNVAGEPIVCSPHDAIRCSRAAGLHGLVLGELWVTC